MEIALRALKRKERVAHIVSSMLVSIERIHLKVEVNYQEHIERRVSIYCSSSILRSTCRSLLAALQTSQAPSLNRGGSEVAAKSLST